MDKHDTMARTKIAATAKEEIANMDSNIHANVDDADTTADHVLLKMLWLYNSSLFVVSAVSSFYTH